MYKLTAASFTRNLEKWLGLGKHYSASLARALYDYCKKELPAKYLHTSMPLYRGIGLSDSQFETLASRKKLKLRTRLISSWSKSLDIALAFIGSSEVSIPTLQHLKLAKQGVVIQINAPQAVVCDVDKVVASHYVDLYDEELISYANVEKEVIVESSKAHLDYITLNNIVAIVYHGKTYRNPSDFLSTFSLSSEEKQTIKQQKILKQQHHKQVQEFQDTFKEFFAKYGMKMVVHNDIYFGHNVLLFPEKIKSWIKNSSVPSMKRDLIKIQKDLPYIKKIALVGNEQDEDSISVFFTIDSYDGFKKSYENWKNKSGQGIWIDIT